MLRLEVLAFFRQVHLSSVPNGIDNRVLRDVIQNAGLLEAVKEPPSPPEIREHLRPQPVPRQWHLVVGGIGEAEQDITKVSGKRDAIYDALVSVVHENVGRQAEQFQTLSDLPHEWVDSFTEDRIHLPRFLRTSDQCSHQAERLLADMKRPEALAETDRAVFNLPVRLAANRFGGNLNATVLAQSRSVKARCT